MPEIDEVRRLLKERRDELTTELSRIERAITALGESVTGEVRRRAGGGQRKRPARSKGRARSRGGVSRNASSKSSPTRSAAGSTRAGGGSKASASTRKSRGGGRPKATREQRLLQQVQKNPGIRIAEAAKRMNASASGLYQVRDRLVAAGKIRVVNKGLHPA